MKKLSNDVEYQKKESKNMKEINKELLHKVSIASLPKLHGMQSSSQNLDYPHASEDSKL